LCISILTWPKPFSTLSTLSYTLSALYTLSIISILSHSLHSLHTLHTLHTLQVMHSQPEEFINYDLLTAHTKREPVYSTDDLHRTRRTQLADAVNTNLWEPLAAQHLVRELVEVGERDWYFLVGGEH
jgi:hypothetical protein